MASSTWPAGPNISHDAMPTDKLVEYQNTINMVLPYQESSLVDTDNKDYGELDVSAQIPTCFPLLVANLRK